MLAEKTLVNWLRFAKFAKLFYRQSFLLYGTYIKPLNCVTSTQQGLYVYVWFEIELYAV